MTTDQGTSHRIPGRSRAIAGQSPGALRRPNRAASRVASEPGRGRRPFFALAALLLMALPARALESETQTWFTTQIVAPLSEETDLSVRVRTRHSEWFGDHRLFQYQLMAGHNLRDGLRVDGGYEQFRTSDERLEDRWMAQLQLRAPWQHGLIRQRLRIEHREIETLEDPVYRLRYLLGHRWPVSKRGCYVELRNEVFVSLSNEGAFERGIAQNRIGATFGQRVGERWRAEFRYQWGYVDRGVLSRGDHLVQFNLTWDGR